MRSDRGIRYFAYAVMGIVAASIAAGFFVIGSPQEERFRRLDERRVSDLQFLQSEILNYWINKSRLPEDLSKLKDDIRGVVIPRDPETAENYEYNVKGSEMFELCAAFSRPSRSRETLREPKPAIPYEGPYIGGENWEHDQGRICFARTIDKEIYKPRLKIQ